MATSCATATVTATATATSSHINEGWLHYPYPSHVNAASFLSIKLSGWTNYARWHEQMLCLLESHEMLGFIDGTLKKPQEYDGSKMEADMAVFEARFKEWKRSDTLVKGWIFGSINEDMMDTVLGLQTANQVWHKLKKDYYTTLIALAQSAPASGPAPAPVLAPAPVTTPISPIAATRRKNEEEYVPLCRAIQMGDWEKAEEIFKDDNHALVDKLNFNGNGTLHVAVGNPDNIWFLERLLEEINSPESLPFLVNDKQQNALHYAAALDNTNAAMKLVEKNPDLLFAADCVNFLPIQIAAINSHKNTFLYLLQVCKQHIDRSEKDGYYNPFKGEKGVLLLNSIIWAGFLDVAYGLLKDYPELARTKYIRAPLWCIAKKWDAYLSSKRYNLYQRFVYSHVPIEISEVNCTNKINDIENQENLFTHCTKSYVYPFIKKIYDKFWKVAVLYVSHIKHLHEDKVKHNTTLMILKFICEEVGKLKSNQFDHYGDAFIVAVENNTPEVVEQITKTIPQSIWVNNSDGYRFPQVSILNRCENVYNFLVHEVTHDKNLLNTLKDKDENNLLHLAGRLAPTHKLNMVTGATLQMQRELQWFEEVSKLVRPSEREARNLKEETPFMIFRKEHKALRQEGEEWMKKTADSYTITAALIITIVFAAAITVPGGNNGDTGKAIYVTRPSFVIFAISDAISLFTSTTSLLLFLSILTARYAEEDFLYKLPKRLILGLVMLFMSVTSMMIAFSATLYILFGHQKTWVLIPIIALTCLPIASFVTLQLPLLVDLISSTYGRGIFGKRSELRITS